MICAVFDTNILVSAFFWGGIPRIALDAARIKQFRLITSDTLIDELKEVLSRPKFTRVLAAIEETVDSLLEKDFRALVEVVQPVIEKDSDDDLLIACAVGGEADYIISGDHHLLELNSFQTVKITMVKQFLEEVLNITL